MPGTVAGLQAPFTGCRCISSITSTKKQGGVRLGNAEPVRMNLIVHVQCRLSMIIT